MKLVILSLGLLGITSVLAFGGVGGHASGAHASAHVSSAHAVAESPHPSIHITEEVSPKPIITGHAGLVICDPSDELDEEQCNRNK